MRSVAGLMKTLHPVLRGWCLALTFSCETHISHEEAFTSLSLSNSPDTLRRTLQKIAFYQSRAADSGSIGNIEDHPESTIS